MSDERPESWGEEAQRLLDAGSPEERQRAWLVLAARVVTLEAVARRLLEGWEPEEAYESLIWSRRRDPDEFEPMSPSEVELIEALRGKG